LQNVKWYRLVNLAVKVIDMLTTRYNKFYYDNFCLDQVDEDGNALQLVIVSVGFAMWSKELLVIYIML
jgi:hypothetical protein